MPAPGKLYLVSTPIGNYDDITIRALRILRETEIVVCEERREGERLLSHFGIRDRTVEILNEHTEAEASSQVMEYLAHGRDVALVSDAGTPVFSDPGFILVQQAIEGGIPIVPIPGPSSIIPALTLSGFAIDRFVFCGFLSPKSARRRAEIRSLNHEARTMIIMDTPYRLLPLLRAVRDVLSGDRKVAVAFNLTLPGEIVYRGTATEITAMLEKEQLKGEFVLIVQGRGGGRKTAEASNDPDAPD